MRDSIASLIRATTAFRTAPRAAFAATLLAIACGLGGCASGGAGTGSFAMASGGATVAFESRDGSSAYRVRSYLSAQVSRGRTTIAWVWDVYDREQQRALRLSGEEPAGKAGRDAWAAADDVVLRRIAQAGLTGLSAMINGTAPPEAPAAPPAPRGQAPAVAGLDPSQPSGAFSASTLSYS